MGSGRGDYSGKSLYFKSAIFKNDLRFCTAITIHGDTNEVYVDRWRNDDFGGTKIKGDGTRFCDMTGDGKDDYIVSIFPLRVWC